jgi:hypothetical protein
MSAPLISLIASKKSRSTGQDVGRRFGLDAEGGCMSAEDADNRFADGPGGDGSVEIPEQAQDVWRGRRRRREECLCGLPFCPGESFDLCQPGAFGAVARTGPVLGERLCGHRTRFREDREAEAALGLAAPDRLLVREGRASKSLVEIILVAMARPIRCALRGSIPR